MTAREHTFEWLNKVDAIIWLLHTRIDSLYAQNHDERLDYLKFMKKVYGVVFLRRIAVRRKLPKSFGGGDKAR